MRLALTLALTLTLLTLLPQPIHAQTRPEIEAAQQLQDAGEYGAAADALRPYLQAFPDDLGTQWLFSRLLFWAGEYDEARAGYEALLGKMPGDPWLRLEYSGLLMGMGEWGEARKVLREVAVGEEAEAVLQADAGLEEIRLLTRPWIRIAGDVLDDSQPFRRYEGSLEGGVFLHPLWTLEAGGTPRVLDVDPQRTGGEGWGRIKGSIPGLGLSLTGMGGATFQDRQSSWVGSADLGVRLPARMKLVASAGRTRYLWTLASTDSLVMMNTGEIRLDRADAPGWAGQAVGRMDSFADGNRVTTAFGWLLAPVAKDIFRVGYAVSWSDAEESRWVADIPGQAAAPGSVPAPGATIPGRYDPYHTPNDETVHSALAELTARTGPATFRLNGSVGFYAREEAPVLIATGPGAGTPDFDLQTDATLYFYERSFTPWRVSLDADLPLSASVTLDARAEGWETAYYDVFQFALGITYRFGVSPP